MTAANTRADTPFLLIMPSYNQSHYIASAVDSVLQQDDPNWVLWIVDNSNDDTPQVMAAYQDTRIHFVHIPERMDPGTCLNWTLEREAEKHRDFSYIHTDNLLRHDYVRQMRAALAQADRCVAYCDMNSLDAEGCYTGIFRRGNFDLARLFSFSSLGVPFAATIALNQDLGGFNRMDVADDVIYCVRAWPRAKFVHIPDAIMDYRTHGDSRTTAHGGAWEIERSFLKAYARLLPEMHELGADPIEALSARISELQTDIRLKLTHLYYRLGPKVKPGDAVPTLDELAARNLIELCDLHEGTSSCPGEEDGIKEGTLKRLSGKIRKRYLRIKGKFQNADQPIAVVQHLDRRAVWELSTSFRHHAVPWVYLVATQTSAQPVVRLGSTDIYTLWATLALHRMCGWRFQVEPSAALNLQAWPHLDQVQPHSPAPTCTISLLPGAISCAPQQPHRAAA